MVKKQPSAPAIFEMFGGRAGSDTITPRRSYCWKMVKSSGGILAQIYWSQRRAGR